MFPRGIAFAPIVTSGGTMYDERTKGVAMESSEPRDGRLTYDDLVLFPDDGMRHERRS